MDRTQQQPKPLTDNLFDQMLAINNVALAGMNAGRDIAALESAVLRRRIAKLDAFLELTQDRASELITHFENRKRVSEIASELYDAAMVLMGDR